MSFVFLSNVMLFLCNRKEKKQNMALGRSWEYIGKKTIRRLLA